MRTFKLTLAYDGTDYAGWQMQSGKSTVQAAVEAALARVTGENVRVAASGRTDAGVHALGQVVSFASATALDAMTLRNALVAELPRDIVPLAVEEAPAGFHARRDATSKRYRYVIHDGEVPDVFRRKYCWHYRQRLDDAAMHRAAQAFVGTHDFRSFESRWPQRSTSVRTIYEASVRRGRGEEADFVVFEVEGDGFLYNMVRALLGTLVEVGRKTQTESWPAEVLAAGDRRAAGMTAPAQGLFLVSVTYGTPRGRGG